ncbi:hypothetical protein CALCODRAFT_508135 [Calocera cornea HHB12733]|uniref:Uncharacterized protein n=1 Tax=Calocera cornea HHB12733 TaxID=1353952 RepID=A0A165GRT8_9BASI|nr:hypothetical protein CALCODRAFT_508135 [Calocera cornea HHB12733]
MAPIDAVRDLAVVGKALVKRIYPLPFRVEQADYNFVEQKHTFSNNRTLLYDVLRKMHFKLVKRMVKNDVMTLFYKDCYCADFRVAVSHLSERHWVLRNWPNEYPLPTNIENLRDAKQATAILWGIWYGKITITKASPEEQHMNAIIRMESGEYHCFHTSLATTASVPLFRPDTPPPAEAPKVPPTTPAKRKRSSTKSEPAAARGAPPCEPRAGVELPVPARKKPRVESVKREESPEIQFLAEIPASPARKRRAYSVPAGSPRTGRTPARGRKNLSGASQLRGVEHAEESIERDSRTALFTKMACHAFHKACTEAIPFEPSEDPVGWMRQMLKLHAQMGKGAI